MFRKEVCDIVNEALNTDPDIRASAMLFQLVESVSGEGRPIREGQGCWRLWCRHVGPYALDTVELDSLVTDFLIQTSLSVDH